MTDEIKKEIERLKERVAYCEEQCATDMIAQDKIIAQLREENKKLQERILELQR